jgi:hypothetical protein
MQSKVVLYIILQWEFDLCASYSQAFRSRADAYDVYNGLYLAYIAFFGGLAC